MSSPNTSPRELLERYLAGALLGGGECLGAAERAGLTPELLRQPAYRAVLLAASSLVARQGAVTVQGVALALAKAPTHNGSVLGVLGGHSGLGRLAREGRGFASPEAITGLVEALRSLADAPDPDHEPLYRVTEDGIWLRDTRLSNWAARITRRVLLDDGEAQSVRYELEVQQRSCRAHLTVPAEEYESLTWVRRAPGLAPWHAAGSRTRDHLRSAIDLHSAEAAWSTRYTHMGWRHLGGRVAYLHAGGAIGALGAIDGVEVELPDALQGLALPPPPEGEEEREAVRASLALADPAHVPDRISWPLQGLLGRAPLGPLDHVAILTGLSGIGKSELAARYQAHWGPVDRQHLPANWRSTANWLAGLLWSAKDALLVMDNLKPAGSSLDQQRLLGQAAALIDAIGDGAGRGRADSRGDPRALHRPRGVALITGEVLPPGYSTTARLFVLEVERGDIDGLQPEDGAGPDTSRPHPWLDETEDLALSGTYAKAQAGYLRWLARRMEREDLGKHVRTRVRELRREARVAGHSRSASHVAELAIGVELRLTYAREIGAITPEEAARSWGRAWAALNEVAQRQLGRERQVRPELRFLELVVSAIAARQAYVASPHGAPPPSPESWGWSADDNGVWRPAPGALLIGWLATDERGQEHLYLGREASWRAADRMAPGSLEVGPDLLPQRLYEAGLLRSIEQSLAHRAERPRRQYLVQRRIEGRKQRVLHLDAALVRESSVAVGTVGTVGTEPFGNGLPNSDAPPNPVPTPVPTSSGNVGTVGTGDPTPPAGNEPPAAAGRVRIW
jgi:hypothetical protein